MRISGSYKGISGKKKATFVAQIAQSILKLTDVNNGLCYLVGCFNGFRIRLVISLSNN